MWRAKDAGKFLEGSAAEREMDRNYLAPLSVVAGRGVNWGGFRSGFHRRVAPISGKI